MKEDGYCIFHFKREKGEGWLIHSDGPGLGVSHICCPVLYFKRKTVFFEDDKAINQYISSNCFMCVCDDGTSLLKSFSCCSL